MLRGVVFLTVVAVVLGAKLNPDAKKIVNAAKELVTIPNVGKSIVLLACKNDDWNNIIKSLDPITPKCLQCLFDNSRTLTIQLQEKKIQESDFPKLLLAACGAYTKELLQLQNASLQAIGPITQTSQAIYGSLPADIKNTGALIQQLGNDARSDPNLKANKTAYCARVKAITDSVRNYNDDDRNFIAQHYPQSANYILTTGSQYSQFQECLDLVDKKCTQGLSDDEEKSLTTIAVQYHLAARNNIVPFLNNATQALQNATTDPKCSDDPTVRRVASKLAQAITKDFNARIKTPAFKKEANLLMKKSNSYKNVVATDPSTSGN